MRIRTFTAATMAEAMTLVRESLGPDAIIVSTYEGRRGRGVEVRAASEGPPPNPRTPDTGETGIASGASHRDERADLEAMLRTRLQEEASAPPPGPDLREAGKALLFHRVPSSLGKAMLSDAKRFNAATAEEAMASAAALRFRFSPIAEVPARPIMLVGPPGAGKTATAAKLAARVVLAGASVSLVTTDTLKVGGKAQFEAFASLLQQPCHVSDSPHDLCDHLKGHGSGTAIIDTPGTNPLHKAEMTDLGAFVRTSGAEPVLVLAAGGDAADLLDTVEVFKGLGVQRVILTRIDTVRRLGNILWLMHTAGLSFAQASATPYVGEGLTRMDPVALTRFLLKPPQAMAGPQPVPPPLPGGEPSFSGHRTTAQNPTVKPSLATQGSLS